MNSRLSVQRIIFGVATVAGLDITCAVGQTIINVPPSPDPFVARSDEVVNVLPGGFLSSGFDALAGSQVNILGGGVGRFFESRTGSTTRITNGFVEQDWTVESGATANIGGGLIDDISAFSGAMVDVRGGAIGAIVSQSTAQVTLRGFDFRINGVPIDGLSIVGAERAFDMPEGSVLSGNYADGTPFAIKDRRNPRTGKAFADGTLRLVRSDVVAAQPGTIRLPGGAPPLGLREGQTLVVNGPEALVPKHFTAGPGSIVELESGRVSDNFSALGSTVNIRGGTLGTFRALVGSTINISAGQAGTQLDAFHAFAGSVVNVSGGETGGAGIFDGGELNVSGGVVASFRAENGRLNITGGKFPFNFGAGQGSVVNISGGNFGRDGGFSDSDVTISGGTFGDDLRSGIVKSL